MKARFEQYRAKFAALSQREKVLVVASAVTVVLLGWFLLIAEPLYVGAQQARSEVASVSKNIAQLQQQLNSLQQRKQDDPLRELNQQLAQLHEQIAKLDVELREKFHGLLEPQQMSAVLESVLKQHKDLVLIRVKSLDAVPLLNPVSPDTASDQTPRVEIYRHGMQVEFEGSYMATLDYLKTLEALPWEFYWDAVQLDVEDYPRARIIITVHTLGLRDAWIGV